MDFEDLEPRNKAKPKKNLDVLSVGELNEYIAALEAEIARAREAIGKKQSHKSAAEGVFKF